MTYGELIDRLSSEMGLTKKETRELVAESVDTFSDLLKEGEGFTVPGLGTFRAEVKDVQKIYNPHHDANMLIPPKRVTHFTPSKSLREKLRNKRPDT